MTAATPFPRSRPVQAVQAGQPLPTCIVRLIDRRTGRPHRINGSPLVLFTRRPEEVAAELLAGRDPTVWEARIEPMAG